MIPGYYRYVVRMYVYVHTCLEEECRTINQSELHTSAATPPYYLLFSVASTINLVGRSILTSFVDRHKNISF